MSSCLRYKSFENVVGKGEIARNEQFLLFPQCFQLFWRTFRHVHQNFILSSATAFSLEASNICRLEKGSNSFIMIKNLD